MTTLNQTLEYTTTLEDMLKESLKGSGETLADVEHVSSPGKLKVPFPCDCCGDVTSIPSLIVRDDTFYAWTKDRVHYLACPLGEYYEFRSVPRNP